jgi:hypothetical protein
MTLVVALSSSESAVVLSTPDPEDESLGLSFFLLGSTLSAKNIPRRKDEDGIVGFVADDDDDDDDEDT